MFENYDKAVDLYLSNMRSNDLSSDTISSYSRTFRMFRDSMEEYGYTQPCVSAVVDFKSSKGEAVSLTTLSLYCTHLRLLCDFGVTLGLFEENFIPDNLLPPKKKVAAERKKEYNHVLSEEDVQKLINADKPLHGRKPQTWLREKAIVTLLLQSGLRNSELRALTPDDLDWASSAIYARVTKGDKPRPVPFPQTAQEAVKSFLTSGLRPAYVSSSEPLFGNLSRKSGKWVPMERSKLSERIHYYTKSVLGEASACRSHALRHGYASLLIEKDVPIQYISETLGHSSVSTTTIYAKRLTKAAPAQAIGAVLDSVISAKKEVS